MTSGGLQWSGWTDTTLGMLAFVLAGLWLAYLILAATSVRRFLPQLQLLPPLFWQERVAQAKGSGPSVFRRPGSGVNFEEAFQLVQAELGPHWRLSRATSNLVAGKAYGDPTSRRVWVQLVRHEDVEVLPTQFYRAEFTVEAEGASIEDAVRGAMGHAKAA